MAKEKSNRISINDAEEIADQFLTGGSGDSNRLKVVHGAPRYIKITDGDDIIFEFGHNIGGIWYKCRGEKGFDPKGCPACKRSMAAFQKKKSTMDKKQQAYWGKIGSDLQSKLHCEIKLVEGEAITVKDRKTGERTVEVEFPLDAKEMVFGVSDPTYHWLFKNRAAEGKKVEITSLANRYKFIGTTSNVVNFPIRLEKKSDDRACPLTVSAINQKLDFEVLEENKIELSDYDANDDIEALKAAVDDYMNNGSENAGLDADDEHRETEAEPKKGSVVGKRPPVVREATEEEESELSDNSEDDEPI